MDVSDRSVWQHDSELVVVICSRSHRLVAVLHCSVAIVWMYPLPHDFEAWSSLLRIKSPDSKIFLGPIDSTSSRFISPAATVAQPLRFRKITFAAFQRLLGALAVLDVGTRTVPSQDAPVLIPQWIVSDQEPAIRSVFSPYSCLQLKSTTVGKPALAKGL